MEYEAKGPRPKRTWREVVVKDCQESKLNKEYAMDRSRWRKLIKDVWWSGWVWMGECFFWYRPTWVVLDKGSLNGCVYVFVCACVRACICACVWVRATDCVLEILLLTQCGEAQHMDSSLSWLGEWSSWEWEFLHSSASIPCCFYSSLCIPQDIVLVLFLHCCSLLLDTQHLSFLQFAGFTLHVIKLNVMYCWCWMLCVASIC